MVFALCVSIPLRSSAPTLRALRFLSLFYCQAGQRVANGKTGPSAGGLDRVCSHALEWRILFLMNKVLERVELCGDQN